MTKEEVDKMIAIQKSLGEEWEHGCRNGIVYLTPPLVVKVYEFFAYLRSQYEQQPDASPVVADRDCDGSQHADVCGESSDCS